MSERRIRNDCARCLSDLIILGIINKQPAHAYKIRKVILEKFGVALYSGVFYPRLRRLENSGIIKGRWETENGRKKRVYNLTAYGKELYSHAVDNCLLILKKLEE